MGRPQRVFRNAVIWSFLMNWGQRGFSSLFALALAAILGPEPAGLMSLALAFILFVQMLLEGGLTNALVQRKQLDHEHLNTVFWTTVFLSVALAAAGYAAAPLWAAACETPELAPIIRALCLLLPIAALTIVQEAEMRKRLDFRSLAIRATVGVGIGGVAGVVAALLGLGVWALVIQTLTQAGASAALLWSLGKFRPTWSYSFGHLRDVLGFSLWVFFDTIGAYANRHAHAIIMGVFFTPLAVGLYTVMGRVRDLVVTVTGRALAGVALPEFSRYQDEPARLKERYSRCIAIASMLSIPPLALIAVSGPAIAGMLGPKWTPYAATAGIALTLLCLQSLTAPVSMFTTSLLQATGRPGLSAAFTWCTSGLTVGGYVIAGVLLREAPLHTQVFGMAASRLAVVALFTVPAQFVMARLACGATSKEQALALVPATVTALAGIAAAAALRSLAPLENWPPVLAFATLCATFGAAAAPAALLLSRELRREAAAMRRAGRDRSAPPPPSAKATGGSPAMVASD